MESTHFGEDKREKTIPVSLSEEDKKRES